MTWGFIWLMLVLKIPIAALLWIVWWAVHQDADAESGPSGGDGGTKAPPPGHRPSPPRLPRARGPHREPTPPAPARTRGPGPVVREPDADPQEPSPAP